VTAVDSRLSLATAAGNARTKRGELAVSVDYDARKKRLHIELASGVGVSIPIGKLEGLAGIPPSVIRTVRIEGGGYGLYWPSLDLDLAVPDLIAGCLAHARGCRRLRARVAKPRRPPSDAPRVRTGRRAGGHGSYRVTGAAVPADTPRRGST
jgi:hypothetical protein